MTETERRQHNDAALKGAHIRQRIGDLNRLIAGTEKERATLNVAAAVERLQREIDQVIRRDERLTQAIDAYRRQIAELDAQLSA